jgi:hypothetical protein
MAFSVNEIRTNLRFGGARPTLFQVQLNTKFNTELGSVSPFMVQGASLPGSNITPIEVGYWGRKIKVAGDRTFDDWSVTVMNDEDFKVRQILETWHNRINSVLGNLNTTGSAAPDNYKEDATVTQYGKAAGQDRSGALRSYKFVGLFPTQIGPIELSWEDNNRIETFQVNFSYDYYTVSGATGAIS